MRRYQIYGQVAQEEEESENILVSTTATIPKLNQNAKQPRRTGEGRRAVQASVSCHGVAAYYTSCRPTAITTPLDKRLT